MSTDLRYLAFTAILTASLWIPYVVAQVKTNGPLNTRVVFAFGSTPLSTVRLTTPVGGEVETSRHVSLRPVEGNPPIHF